MKEPPRRLNVTPEQIQQLTQRAREHSLAEEDYELIAAIGESILFLRRALEEKSSSEKKLLRMIFGPFTEAADIVLEGKRAGAKKNKKKRKGHGRNGSTDYPGARRVRVTHTEMKHGQQCPECRRGKVYRERDPGVLIRFIASVPVDATVYEIENLRCNACGQIFAAPLPPEAQKPKYDETVGAMLGVLRYGSGLPMNRIESLQSSFGIPLPASTQWEIVDRMVEAISPAYEELIRQGAQGQIIHNDDTGMKILALCDLRRRQKLDEEDDDEADKEQADARTGCFTSGFVCQSDGRKIALFFTGPDHAGENMETLLKKRSQERGPPIQMCDGLSRNLPESFAVIPSNCLSHGRRRFVDVAEDFPEECRFVIETLKEVFRNEEIALQEKMSGAQRLAFHQKESKPWMDKLETWLHEQFDQKKVEPNSTLGKAISYMLKRWKPLTLFLQVENAPLHNNVCERALKKAVLHRKNSLFYRSFRGAYVGDALMSLIHTCNLSKVSPFQYLVALQLHHRQLKNDPQHWMPWNYRAIIAQSTEPSSAR